jgi:parallel beta-helix repeat protein
VAFDASSTEAEISDAFQFAQAGTTFLFGPGTYSFTNSLGIQVPGISVIGAGLDQTIFDFSGQSAGADGISALSGSDDLLLQGFDVRDAKGNAIKVEGSRHVIFEGVKTEWTHAHDTNNGPYGIYPVQVTDLLIENCVVIGASDSGVYVGQSQNAIVRNNEVYGNVAGIEIENTFFADVYGNNAHDNTAGILIFDLPNLQQQGGHDVRVFDNLMVHNNGENFAANGDIVGVVPSGSGFIFMANHEVEAFNNTILDNNTTGVAVISYYLSERPITDPNYYPFPYDGYVHDNYVAGNGTSPDSSRDLGLLLALVQGQLQGGHVPDLMYDGFVDPAFAADAGIAAFDDGGLPSNINPMNICFRNNGGDGGAATFGNLNAAKLEIYLQLPDGGVNPGYDGGQATNLGEIISQDATPFDCSGSTVAPVVIDGGLLPDGGP